MLAQYEYALSLIELCRCYMRMKMSLIMRNLNAVTPWGAEGTTSLLLDNPAPRQRHFDT
jgi:hypothetical protein